MSSMMLHCGAEKVTLDDILDVTTPEPTDTWHPIGYGELVGTVKDSLTDSGLEIAEEEYGLWSDKSYGEAAMFFGLLTLAQASDDHALSIGLRSSHNQRFATSLVAGSRVFVCDNLAFSGEVRINRKQTRWAYRDLVRLVMESMGKIQGMWKSQAERYESYKKLPLTEAQVHDILIRSMDAKVMANSYIKKVLEQWREPNHDEFQPRNAWSLFNSYTEVFKQTNPLDLPQRTTRLHGLLDSVVEATENRMAVDDLLKDRAPRLAGAEPQGGTLELIGIRDAEVATA